MKLNPPAFLVVATTGLVIGLVVLLFYKEVPNSIENVLFTLIGTILAKWQTVVDYHFGSSSGSAKKSDMLNELTGTGDGTTKTTATVKTEISKTATTEPKETP